MNDVRTQPGLGGSVAVTDVLVIDDHRTFTDLLALALRGEADLNCVGTAETVAAGIALADRLRPDVVVMDVHVGDDDGISATALLVARHPGIRVLVLTAHADQAVMRRASDAGACALLPKDGSLDEMLSALRTAREGGFVVHPQLLKRLLGSARQISTGYIPPLTRREHDVLQLLAAGLDARTAAKSLGITVHTYRGYVRNLLVKLDAHSQLEAVAIASKGGLLSAKTRR